MTDLITDKCTGTVSFTLYMFYFHPGTSATVTDNVEIMYSAVTRTYQMSGL
jgi:hypothetical protein